MSDLQKLAEQLVNLSVKDVKTLSDILKEEHGIEAAPVAAPVAVQAASAEAGQEAQEQTHFDVVLQEAGQTKLKVIKAVKEILGLGLKEAKEVVDSAPKAVKEKVEKSEADNLKQQLEEAGATVVLK